MKATPIITLLEGDCIDMLPTIGDETVHAVITDPPYNLGFMGKGWDKDTIAFYPEFWEEVMRTMKPGAHLAAFGGSRTYHRLACAIEDAGFEIRDTLCWLYGSGFPKSLDVSKAIDKAAGATREVVGTYDVPGYASANVAHGAQNRNKLQFDKTSDTPATPEAAQWQGWGTALKPAFEPIIVARKPLGERTVAANVLAHGTGAMNIDACRIPTSDDLNGGAYSDGSKSRDDATSFYTGTDAGQFVQPAGRHPANVIHDGSDEVEAAFAAFGESKSATGSKPRHGRPEGTGYGMRDGGMIESFGDSGTASRFFYSAKAGKADREDSKHPTVKPIALMQHLCELLTPPGGTILDCFAGSGTTLLAAKWANFNAIGIEREPEYIADIKRRLEKRRGFFT